VSSLYQLFGFLKLLCVQVSTYFLKNYLLVLYIRISLMNYRSRKCFQYQLNYFMKVIYLDQRIIQMHTKSFLELLTVTTTKGNDSSPCSAIFFCKVILFSLSYNRVPHLDFCIGSDQQFIEQENEKIVVC
jgi:hypothetical protein